MSIREQWKSEKASDWSVTPSKVKLQPIKRIEPVAKTFSEILEKANPYHDELGRFATAPGGGGGGAVGKNGVTTEEQDAAYMAAIESGDLETAQQMVLDTAKAVGAKTFANPDTTAYSIRRGPEPKTTVTVYKTFFVDENGNPSALFVEGTERLPVDVWLDAKDAYHFQADNGKMYTPSRKNPNSGGSGKTGANIKIPNDQVRQELIDQGFLPEGSTAKDVTALAYRPGWHAGDLPFFPQGGKQGNPELTESGKPNKRYDPSKPATNYQNIHRWNQVVFECEMAADVDYTKSSTVKSGPHKGKTKYTDMQQMPSDGYYKFATNPMTNANELGTWYISGSLRIKRALTQQECDDILGKNGFKPQEWEGGKLDLGKLGYNPNKTDRGTKLLDPVTYDDSGKVIPLSQRFDSSSDDVRKSDDDGLCTIYKTDEDKRLVFGWASISMTVDGEQLVDRQHDMIDPEDLEEAVYEYVLNFRDMGEEHVPSLRKKGKLVESCVLTEEKQRAMGIPPGILPVGWWIGFKIEDDEAWEKVKNGTYKMFSIEGKANRVPVEKRDAKKDYDAYPEYGMWLEENLDATMDEQKAAKKHYFSRSREENREANRRYWSVGKTFENSTRFEQIMEIGKSDHIDRIVEIEKFNDRHDPATGRFAPKGTGVGSASGGAGKAIITSGKVSEKNVAKHVEKVRKAVGNSYDPITKEDANLDKIKERGGCTDAEAKKCAELADGVFAKAAAAEPQITKDVVGLVADNGGKMYGLAHRMKQPSSMGGKIAADSKTDNVSFEEAAAAIKDSVRYTAIFEDGGFVSGYNNVKKSLESQGYKEVRCKNFFQKYEDGTSCQKAVQCVYKNKDGLSFELQFHTYSTQGAKEVNHPFYEEQRAVGTTKRRFDKLNAAMTQISSYSAVPDGVLDIKSHP